MAFRKDMIKGGNLDIIKKHNAPMNQNMKKEESILPGTCPRNATNKHPP